MTTCSQDVANGEAEATGPAAPNPPATPATSSAKGGAPAGNQNRTRHAIFSLGLPSGTSHIAERLNRLRRDLAGLVEERDGKVSLYAAAVIDAAVKWERLGQLAGRWLRKEGDKLAPTEKLTFAKEIARAAVERNRAMAALGLDVAPNSSPWAALDAEIARGQLESALTRDAEPIASSGASSRTDAPDLRPPSDSYARPIPEATETTDAADAKFGGLARPDDSGPEAAETQTGDQPC